MSLIYFPIIVSLFALVYVWFLASQTKKTAVVKDGAVAVAGQKNFNKKYKAVAIVGIVLFILLFFVPSGLGLKIAIGFLLGALASLLLEFVASKLEKSAVELTVASLALLVISVFYFLTKDAQAIIGLIFGAGFISFFFANISDIFETYLVATASIIILGSLLFPRSPQFVLLPLILGSASILISIIIGLAARILKGFWAKNKAIIGMLILSAAGFYLVISRLMAGQAIEVNNLYFASLLGLIIAVGIFASGKYPRFKKYIQVFLAFAGVAVSFWLAGFYGVGIAVISMLSIFSISNAEASAGFVSLLLFFVYFEQTSARGILIYNLDYIRVIAGILLGGVFSSLFVLSLGATKHRKIIFPALVIILAPILVGFILGPEALDGLLVGSIIVGFFTAVSATTSKINPFMKGVCIVALLIIGLLV